MTASNRSLELVEVPDYQMDLDMTKKAVICAELKRLEKNKDIDECYASFFNDLVELYEAVGVEEDEDDPAYRMFLDNLRENGNAYMLDASMEHGVPFPIKYEDDNVTPYELKRKKPTLSRCTLVREGSSSDMVDTPNVLKRKTPKLRKCTLVREHSSSDMVDSPHELKRKAPRTRSCTLVRERSNSDRVDTPNELKRRAPITRRCTHDRERLNSIMDDTPNDLERKAPRTRNCTLVQERSSSNMDDMPNELKRETPRPRSCTLVREHSCTLVQERSRSDMDDSPDELKRKTPRTGNCTLVRECSSSDMDDTANELKRKPPKPRSCTLVRERSSSDLDGTPNELQRKGPKPRSCILVRERSSLDMDAALSFGGKKIGSLEKYTHRDKRSRIFGNVGLDSGMNYCSEKDSPQRHSSRIMENSSNAQDEKAVSNPSRKVDCLSDKDCRFYSRHATTDKLYKIFLDGLRVVGQSVFYESEAGKRVYYEMNDLAGSTIVEILPSKKAHMTRPPTPPLGLPSPGPSQPPPTSRPQTPRQSNPTSGQGNPTVKDHCIMSIVYNKALKNNRNAFQGEHARFWKELKSIVSEPYEREEYDSLLYQVNVQKLVKGHKETRTGGYQFTPGHMGKSYLQTHPDLACEIEEVKSDRHKVLNLLRGFFLYLRYAPHNVPRPWKDDIGKIILLGSS